MRKAVRRLAAVILTALVVLAVEASAASAAPSPGPIPDSANLTKVILALVIFIVAVASALGVLLVVRRKRAKTVAEEDSQWIEDLQDGIAQISEQLASLEGKISLNARAQAAATNCQQYLAKTQEWLDNGHLENADSNLGEAEKALKRVQNALRGEPSDVTDIMPRVERDGPPRPRHDDATAVIRIPSSPMVWPPVSPGIPRIEDVRPNRGLRLRRPDGQVVVITSRTYVPKQSNTGNSPYHWDGGPFGGWHWPAGYYPEEFWLYKVLEPDVWLDPEGERPEG